MWFIYGGSVHQPEQRSPRTTVAGWIYVSIQALILVVLIVIPSADHWPVPGWLTAIASAVGAIGVAVVVIAAAGLGKALTPTPVPRSDAALTTTGLYGLVRHPIYTGVLLIVIGVTVRSGNVITVFVAAATWVFFVVKSQFEERQLRAVYPDYAAYSEVTPRLIPRLSRLRHIRRGGRAPDTPRRPGR